MTLADTNRQVRFVIHDRDTKFTAALDEVFSVDGIRIIKTPVRAPRANAVAERWIRSARGELLDWQSNSGGPSCGGARFGAGS
jgi:putative transposase